MKTKVIFWAIFSLFLYCFFMCTPFLYTQTQSEVDILSGPKSLLAVFKTLGIETNLDEVKNLSGYEEGKGTTMAGLSKAAESKGLYSLVMKIGVEELAKLKIPIIVHCWDGSFQAIDKFEQNKIRIISYGSEPILMSQKDLDNTYSGFAILIFKDKTLFPKLNIIGPDIRFNEYVFDFDIVKAGEIANQKLEHIFKFKNIGNKELVISRVAASCGCTATILSNKNIAPEGEGEIKVTFNIEGRTGSQSTNVQVFSNDPITPIVKLQIKVIIQGSAFNISPQAINFGDVKRKSPVSQKLYVTPPENEELNIIKIESSSEYISTKIFENKKQDSKSFEVEVSLNPDILPGELNEKITIYTDSEKYPKTEVSVTGNIKGDIEIQPSKFFFGLAGEIRTPKVTLLNTGKEPFNIEKIDNPLEFISVAVTPKTEGKEYEITATLKENTPPTSIKGNITVYTNNPDQPKIQIPVYCLSNNKLSPPPYR